MKLGTETGSMTNHLYSRMVKGQPEPVVGMGATSLCWTDRHAGTITKVFKIGTALAVEVQEDKAERADANGMSECQSYEYTANPNGARTTYRFRNNRWEQIERGRDEFCQTARRMVRVVGPGDRWRKTEGGNGLRIGDRDAYHDFSF